MIANIALIISIIVNISFIWAIIVVAKRSERKGSEGRVIDMIRTMVHTNNNPHITAKKIGLKTYYLRYELAPKEDITKANSMLGSMDVLTKEAKARTKRFGENDEY